MQDERGGLVARDIAASAARERAERERRDVTAVRVREKGRDQVIKWLFLG